MDAADIVIIDEKQSTIHRLYRQAQYAFDEKDSDSHKAAIAKNLNTVIARVQYSLETSADDSDIEFAEAALDTVFKLAKVEDLTPINTD